MWRQLRGGALRAGFAVRERIVATDEVIARRRNMYGLSLLRQAYLNVQMQTNLRQSISNKYEAENSCRLKHAEPVKY